jgi:hypothetical protein
MWFSIIMAGYSVNPPEVKRAFDPDRWRRALGNFTGKASRGGRAGGADVGARAALAAVDSVAGGSALFRQRPLQKSGIRAK